MQYTVNRGEKGKIDVKVDVPKASFEAEYKVSVDRLGQSAKISGFRPGKAPANVVEQYVGLGKLLNETASVLISKYLSEIFKKEDLVPVDSPKVAVETLAKDSPFSFSASFSLKPKVKVGAWKKINIKKLEVKKITEEDVNQSIKNIFEAYKKKGQVARDQSQAEQGEAEETGKFIYDAQGNRIPISDDQSKSKSEGEDKIDDEFAKKIGARDLAHLKEIVKGDLEKLVTNQVEAKFEEELFEKLGETGEVEVPDVLVEDELNRILVRLNSQLNDQGKKLEDYLKEQNLTIDQLKDKWRDQAEKNVKTTLILDEIGKSEKMTVSKEEVEQSMKNLSQTNLPEDQRADLERYVAVSIFQAKTLDLVKKTISA